MKNPYLEIQELANNVVSLCASCLPTLSIFLLSCLMGVLRFIEHIFFLHLPLQAQQEFPQDVYSEAPSEADLEALYDALRRQREGLEYITDILT